MPYMQKRRRINIMKNVKRYILPTVLSPYMINMHPCLILSFGSPSNVATSEVANVCSVSGNRVRGPRVRDIFGLLPIY